MLSFLKNHPFAIEAYFEYSIVLTFAFPKEQLQALIPPCLELDTYDNKWAFVAVAMVQTTGLRPRGFPKLLGNDFFLTGYRIFVRYNNHSGKKYRGLYILKSETDKKKMEWLGNLFTHYRYTTTDIKKTCQNNQLHIQSLQSCFTVLLDLSKDASLPSASPFPSWKEARRFAGPLPFTFSYNNATNNILIIEGVRKNWVPKPIEVLAYRFSFLQQLQHGHGCLANAFMITHVPYYWRKGKLEKWQG